MGALGGAAAGGYTGHKANHGFLGTIGGALVGHLAEEAIKKHGKKSNSPPPNGSYDGNNSQYGAPPSNGSNNNMMDQLSGFFKK